ncbi:MAG: IPT/TIG domain-containing protein [Chloroflexota bacterium]
MEILSPRVLGPLSECSRSVIYENALPGATVILQRIRGGTTVDVGEAVATSSRGIVTLNAGEELAGGDQVSALQKSPDGISPPQKDTIEVQGSEGVFSPPQVLTHLYQCSRGFSLGAMRPGTRVEILSGVDVVATGDAIDGTAFVRVVHTFGLPSAGTVLTARQRVCPKPPPPGGAAEWVIDTPLPPVELLPIPIQSGTKVPAPTITAGLTACSRAVQLTNVIPGAEVVVEDTNSGWWASIGPSDQTSVWLPLLVGLVEGRDVEIRQEIGDRCEMRPDRKRQTVGPRATLDKPTLFQIDCNTSPQVFVSLLKPEADVEFEVTFQGNTTIYRTVATQPQGAAPGFITYPVPAPPTPDGAVVRVRQGECDHWSDWSDPQTAHALSRPVLQPTISGDLFFCQNSVPVANIDPLSGTLRVISSVLGEIGHRPADANIMLIPVAPSLHVDHDITVEHEVCGMRARSEAKRVKPLADPNAGEMVGPLFDGDTSVSVKGVTAGAYIEIWDQTHRLQNGYAPFSNSGKVNVTFSGFGALHAGQQIYAKFWHCGHYGRNNGLAVEFRPPVLDQISPATAVSGSAAFTLTAKGSAFRSGALLRWGGANRTTTFISATEVRAAIPATDVASAHTVAVTVVNSDGKATGPVQFTVAAPPPPTPPQITNYNIDTLVVTGKAFLPNHTVFVRVAASGNVPDGFGGTRSDLRDNFLTMVHLTSDNAGNISGVVDPKTALQPITIDAVAGTTWNGAWHGQTVTITAHDGRPGSGVDGVLWSTAFSVTAP